MNTSAGMKKIAVIAGGWHFPIAFFEQMAQQQVPEGWSVDLFCISHRDPSFSVEDKKDILPRLGLSYPETLDRILYRKIATVEEIEALGWKYHLCPNTIGDWGNTNQWLEKYDYRDYDILLATHDDNLILGDSLFTDLLAKESSWLMLTNSTGSAATWREFVKVRLLRRAMNVRGSFEFIKPELLNLLGGQFDLSDTTLTREGELHSDRSLKTLNNWNMNVVPLRRFLDEHGLAGRVKALARTYRVSDYCIEGERGFISSIQPRERASVRRGLRRIEKRYTGHAFEKA
jgi:hypothetical protein